jgi:hypothetical protein
MKNWVVEELRPLYENLNSRVVEDPSQNKNEKLNSWIVEDPFQNENEKLNSRVV